MQPHSMCGVALANYMWNAAEPTGLLSAVMRIEYKLRDRSRALLYELTNIRENKDHTEIKAYVMRGGGGIACQLTLSRNSAQEGTEVNITHSQNHLSGLKESFKLYKNQVTQGRHRNSEKYKDFKGENNHPDKKKFVLDSEVKRKTDGPYDYRWIHYELEIVGTVKAS